MQDEPDALTQILIDAVYVVPNILTTSLPQYNEVIMFNDVTSYICNSENTMQ